MFVFALCGTYGSGLYIAECSADSSGARRLVEMFWARAWGKWGGKGSGSGRSEGGEEKE